MSNDLLKNNRNVIKLSIIIPIYNTPLDLLDACLHSITDSDIKFEYEVLAIDDGSTKVVEQVIDRYNKVLNIHYYRKINGGVSSARNLGIKKAKGEWVTFLDPDDLIFIHHRLEKVLDEKNEDIIFFPYSRLIKERKVVKNYKISNLINDRDLQGKQLIDGLLRVSQYSKSLNGFYLGTPWGKLFRLSFLKQHNIIFDEKLTKRQDALFCANCYANMTSYDLISDEKSNYYYRIDNSSSITKKYNVNLQNVYIYLFRKMVELGDNVKPNVEAASLQLYCYELTKELVNLDFCNVLNPKPYIERKKDFLDYRNNSFLNEYYISTNLRGIHIWKKILYFLIKKRKFWILNLIFVFRKIGQIL